MTRALAAGALLCLAALRVDAAPLRVCADPDNLPFSDRAGAGFENKVVALLARELGREVEWVWWAQRRGNLRNTLLAGACDVVPGVAADLETVRTTRPLYRSTYVFVARADLAPPLRSLDDPRLATLTIAVPLVGDDGANPPPAEALAVRGRVDNVRGFMVYGDGATPDPLGEPVRAVADGHVDVAVVWGPVGGWYAGRVAGAPLAVNAVEPWLDGPRRPMVFDVSMAVRRDDVDLRRELDAAIVKRRADIDAILREYRVPRVDAAAPTAPGRE